MNLGFSEMLFIFLLALIVVGPKRLPELARQFGRVMAEIKRASNDFQAQVQEEVRQLEIEETAKKFQKAVGLDDMGDVGLDDEEATPAPTILAPEGVVVRDATAPKENAPADESEESHREQTA
jgi:Tat protein translocase TatB subunit